MGPNGFCWDCILKRQWRLVLLYGSIISFFLLPRLFDSHADANASLSITGFQEKEQHLSCIHAQGKSLALCVPFGVAGKTWLPSLLTTDSMGIPMTQYRCLDSGKFPLLLPFTHGRVLVWTQEPFLVHRRLPLRNILSYCIFWSLYVVVLNGRFNAIHKTQKRV